ncbi:cadherin-like protein 26 [Clarias gariepinus]|uniref:cadherin-like protein 26 n=1 Tax=Clarias gariepinus TaxID=13013 RepID=UPI00234E0457|nr:cadherin-like protein 26 [Clarias gariepinus]
MVVSRKPQIWQQYSCFQQWAESSPGELRSQENKNEKTSHVLIRNKRRWVLSTFEIEENLLGPFPQLLTQLHNDQYINGATKFRLSGQGVTEEPKGVFTIKQKTGEIFIHKPLDREAYSILKVQFDVLDQNDTLVDKSLYFNVIITDKNDNPPVFFPDILIVYLPENLKEGILPYSLKASDRDEEGKDNSRISMRIVSQYPAVPIFFLKPFVSMQNSLVSKLGFIGCFDYDKVKSYKILVEARDHGKPSLSSTATINVFITDSNTHAPVFTLPKFSAQVNEMETNKEILRIPVTDQDTPKTPASRAVFTILKGNEEGNYKIETDPITNEGVLTVIKGKDYERTTLAELEVRVENEEPLFVCINGRPFTPVPKALKNYSTAKIAVKVIDVNDPPVFRNKIQKIYRIEGEEPGDVLYTPTVTDEDSDPANIRYELVHDPAQWMSIDPKTGKITLVKKLDHESPYLQNSTYTVTMRAIDDGEPPATSTGTLVVYVGDKNDNAPHLTSNTSVMCVNKVDRVRLIAEDTDAFPFSGPFTFMLGRDDQELQNLWKLEKSIVGTETSLISLNILPYGNYTVPLKILDQQGVEALNILQVMVCDCGKADVCRRPRPRSSRLHIIAIGILLGALLMMPAFLLMAFLLSCKEKKTMIPSDETPDWYLINSNIETPGTDCKMPPKIPQLDMSENVLNTTKPLGAQNVISTQESLLQNGFESGIEQQMIRRSLRRSSTRHSYRQIKNYDMMVRC